jgi:hypothetical protein
MQCQSLFLCVYKHLICYIYKLCVHVQMNAPPYTYCPPGVLVLKHEEPLLSTSKDLCRACEAEDVRSKNNFCDSFRVDHNGQQMLGVMPLQYMGQPKSESVAQVTCFQNITPEQYMSFALHNDTTTQILNKAALRAVPLDVLSQNHTAPCMPTPIMLPAHNPGGAGIFGRIFNATHPDSVLFQGRKYYRAGS